MTVTEFIAKHPEFRNVPDLVASALDGAALFASASVFGDRYEKAIEYKACALLASGKYGQIQPTPNTAQTVDYEALFKGLLKLNPIRGMVT